MHQLKAKSGASFQHLSIADTLLRLDTTLEGLTSREAAARTARAGPNAIPEEPPEHVVWIFAKQFQGPLIAILFAAALIVFFMGDYIDALVILIVLVINAGVGAVQEGRAQKRLAALKNITETTATVIRDGKEMIIKDEHVAQGDIILLKEGDRIPADARLIVANELSIDEAALTGESAAVIKDAESIFPEDTMIGDQKNTVFKGTYVLSGLGKAVVASVGRETIIGKLAEKLSTIETDVPLKASIKKLTNGILVAMSFIIVILFTIGLQAGYDAPFMFRTVVAVAVSFIPEGLPVVVTLILATGVWRMSEQHALVKKLQAVEALGQAKVIALDKTGTITKNQMMVEALYTDGAFFTVSGNGYEPTGVIRRRETGESVVTQNYPEMELLGKISLFTSIATLAVTEKTNEWQRISGEPTEAALVVLGEKIGFTKEGLETQYTKRLEIPFSSKLKYHATIHKMGRKELFSIASAPEVVLSHMTSIMEKGVVRKVKAGDRARLEGALQEMSDEGLRVLALAISQRPGKTIDRENLPGLTFIGFVGITDVIREEVYGAVEASNKAGVTVVMITGDYRDTAKAIAQKIGILKEGNTIVTGSELDTMEESALLEILPSVRVFARVTPEHKLKIIEAYKRRGDIIAMTGDGVNDALSLLAADLGVAMGKIGTEVAKEAADIVLLDDNFGSIVAAIEEGRNIYRSIRKVVLYLLSTAVGEVLAISVAIIAGFPIPLTPSQIIWLNLVTDGFLVVALGLEPKAEGLLQGESSGGKSLVTRLMFVRIMCMGAVMTIVTLFLYTAYLPGEFVKASTVALSALAVTQWFNAWNCRSSQKSIFSVNWFQNKFLVYAALIVIVLQLIVVYVPFMQNIFRTTALSLFDWLVIILVSLSVLLVEELRKLIHRATTFSKTT